MIIYHRYFEQLDGKKNAIAVNIPEEFGFDILVTVSQVPAPTNVAAVQSHLNRGAIMIVYDNDTAARDMEELNPSYHRELERMSQFDAEPRQKMLMLGGDELDEKRSLYSNPMREWISLGGAAFFVYGDLYSELLQWEKSLIAPNRGIDRLLTTLPNINNNKAKTLADEFGIAALTLLTAGPERGRENIAALLGVTVADIEQIRLWMGLRDDQEVYVIAGDTYEKMERLAEELGGKVKIG